MECLNESAPLSAKDLKKAAKVKTDKELYLALGWLLREDKLVVAGTEKRTRILFEVIKGL